MSACRIAPPATQDLEEIYDYVARDNLRAAGRLIEQLTETFRLLSGMREMGRLREDLLPGMQSFPVGAYLIFYRQADSGIQILRVLHGARDIDGLSF